MHSFRKNEKQVYSPPSPCLSLTNGENLNCFVSFCFIPGPHFILCKLFLPQRFFFFSVLYRPRIVFWYERRTVFSEATSRRGNPLLLTRSPNLVTLCWVPLTQLTHYRYLRSLELLIVERHRPARPHVKHGTDYRDYLETNSAWISEIAPRDP